MYILKAAFVCIIFKSCMFFFVTHLLPPGPLFLDHLSFTLSVWFLLICSRAAQALCILPVYAFPPQLNPPHLNLTPLAPVVRFSRVSHRALSFISFIQYGSTWECIWKNGSAPLEKIWNLPIHFSYANTPAALWLSQSPPPQSAAVLCWVSSFSVFWLAILFQVMETIQWLSNFFYKLRLSTLDFKSFGLFSKWSPYMADMKTFLGYLVKRLLDSEMACLAQDPSASSKTGNMPLCLLCNMELGVLTFR